MASLRGPSLGRQLKQIEQEISRLLRVGGSYDDKRKSYRREVEDLERSIRGHASLEGNIDEDDLRADLDRQAHFLDKIRDASARLNRCEHNIAAQEDRKQDVLNQQLERLGRPTPRREASTRAPDSRAGRKAIQNLRKIKKVRGSNEKAKRQEDEKRKAVDRLKTQEMLQRRRDDEARAESDREFDSFLLDLGEEVPTRDGNRGPLKYSQEELREFRRVARMRKKEREHALRRSRSKQADALDFLVYSVPLENVERFTSRASDKAWRDAAVAILSRCSGVEYDDGESNS